MFSFSCGETAVQRFFTQGSSFCQVENMENRIIVCHVFFIHFNQQFGSGAKSGRENVKPVAKRKEFVQLVAKKNVKLVVSVKIVFPFASIPIHENCYTKNRHISFFYFWHPKILMQLH